MVHLRAAQYAVGTFAINTHTYIHTYILTYIYFISLPQEGFSVKQLNNDS